MPPLPGFCLAFVLALLLIGTTPMGTGAGVHQFDLVHPLFEHVHILNGRIVTHDQGVSVSRPATTAEALAGPAFGAGSGADQGSPGLGFGPTVPVHAVSFSSGVFVARMGLELRVPVGRLAETPPDPPPTSAS